MGSVNSSNSGLCYKFIYVYGTVKIRHQSTKHVNQTKIISGLIIIKLVKNEICINNISNFYIG